jgi:RND superfamily putative drug exporter
MPSMLDSRPATAPPPATGALAGLARWFVRRRRVVLLLAALAVIAAALAGLGVGRHLSSGGFTPDEAPSARADRILAQRFGAGAPNVVLVVHASEPGAQEGAAAETGPAALVGRALTRRLAAAPGVVYAQSFWNSRDRALLSRDGRTALILVKVAGNENTARATWNGLAPSVVGKRGPLRVQATGSLVVNEAIDAQSARDLSRAELVAAPLTALILLAAFGSLVAAGLPLLVGGVSAVGTLAVLRGLAAFTPVSVFAQNVTTLLGLGLAIDYSLFLVTRYREELGRGHPVTEAIAAALRSAGRTVLFSALTVMASLAALTVFPIFYLRSLAFAGIAVVALAAGASLVILPPVLAVIGRRIDRLDVFAPLRRRLPGNRTGRGIWYRLAVAVTHRPVVAGAAVTVLLVTLALPFTHARFGLADDRVLPRGAAAQVAAGTIRTQFPRAATSPVVVVVPGRVPAAVLASYARRLSAVPHTLRVGGPFTSTSASTHGAWLSLVSSTDPDSPAGEHYIQAIRAVPAPGPALVGGDAATLVDEKAMLRAGIGWAAAIIAVSMLVLLFLFAGSLVIPLQALVLNLLSLTASFGAMAYIFQNGHLRWLVGDFVATGRLELTTPLLMFCVAFGLSMDYTVFLLSRVREHYFASGDTTGAVVAGLDHTGRLITAAALIVATVLGALTTSGISLLKMLGFGLALAVLIDATLVRGLLVPAVMKLTGRASWWAPRPLARLHARIGLHDS